MLYPVQRRKRDVLRVEALHALARLGDNPVSLTDDPLHASFHYSHHLPLILLLEDLGWAPGDGRSTYYVTMSAPELSEAAAQLHRIASDRLRRCLADTSPDPAGTERCVAVMDATCSLQALTVFALRAALGEGSGGVTENPVRRLLPRENRDVLRAAVRRDFSRLPLALADAIHDQRFSAARSLGAWYADAVALLDDLGWEPDAEDRYEVTLPDDQLARLLLRFVNATVIDVFGPRRSDGDAGQRTRIALNKQITATCGALLQQLPADVVAEQGRAEPRPAPTDVSDRAEGSDAARETTR